MGEVKVPEDKYFGAQTIRSFNNFKVGKKMPIEIIKSFAYLKIAAARANMELGNISKEKEKAIEYICNEIISEKLNDQFPLVVYQTGSGTQTNMNVNEVIANRGKELFGTEMHPNDDVNKSQSSNDTFPTAMAISSTFIIEDCLLPELKKMIATLKKLENRYKRLIKTGRTHLEDAVPITFGQEISGWRFMFQRSYDYIKSTLPSLKEVALGATAVGTGLNAHKNFAKIAIKHLNKITKKDFTESPNKFYALSSKDSFAFAHGGLKALAADLMKISNDIRWMASGPRSGLAEITIPANEPGSSIMPGKVNPTQTESATMVAMRVMGNDIVVGFSASQGNFELNVFMPVIADAFIESAMLLTESLKSLREHCIEGLKANENVMKQNAENSLMIATALNTHIGYDNAAKVAKKANEEGITLREAGIALKIFSNSEYNQWVDLNRMVGIDEANEEKIYE